MKSKKLILAFVLSSLYLISIAILEYFIIFVFFRGWHLELSSKLLLLYLGVTALGIMLGVIGLSQAKSWGSKLILIVSALNLLYSLYGLCQNVIIEAIENYQYNQTFGQAPGNFISLVIFIAFNLYFLRLGLKYK
jgi:hypothetical protein